MPINNILLKSRIHDYKAFFCDSADFMNEIANLPNSIFIVDAKVWEFHADGCLNKLKDQEVIVLPIHEEKKNLNTVQELYDQVMKKSPKRNLNIVSIGGGIIQDITGFMASTLYRGVSWTFIPTTLLAQTDSCIGSKTSLNYNKYKNLIGTFYPPNEIYIYTPLLKTLTTEDYFSGIGEMAKVHIMGGESTTKNFIEEIKNIIAMDNDILLKAIQDSLSIKRSFMESDEFDTGRRNMLNYGHCFGHAIEYATNFGVPHGQGVVIGMLLANIVAKNRELLSKTKERFLAENVLIPSLKVNFANNKFNTIDIIEAMRQDKKRTGSGLALVMVNDSYDMVKVNDLSDMEVENSIKELDECLKITN